MLHVFKTRRGALLLLGLSLGCRTGLPIDGVDGGGGGGLGGAGGAPFCGDGVINLDEECDGENLGGVDCTSLGYANPQGFSCEACLLIDDCQPFCGNLVVEPGETCDDGNTVADDGCSPTCFGEGDTCGMPTTVVLDVGAVSLFGSLGGGANHVPNVSSECPAGAGAGPENVYAVSVNVQGHVTAYLPSSGTNFNSILYSRTACGNQSAELSCHDNDAGGGAGEVITTWLEPGEIVYVFVDTGGASVGDYELVLDLSRGGVCDDVVPITVEGTKPLRLLGRISSLSNDAAANGCSADGVGPDAVYGFTFTESDTYQLDLETSAFNSVTHMRSNCADPFSEITCDSPSNSDDSSISLSASANQTLFYWVDSIDPQSGPYSIRVTH